MVPPRELVDRLVDEILRINPLQRSFLQASLADLRDGEADHLAAYIRYCWAMGVSPSALASHYDVIVNDTLREQMYFMRHRRYRHATFAEVANSVYFDAPYMQAYMHGLALTSFLWPNHRAILRFFSRQIPTDVQGAYLEVGPGHGVYLATAMQRTAYQRFIGIDISPTSVAMTERLMTSGTFGRPRRLEMFCADFLDLDSNEEHYHAIVMGEVLEHVEQPVRFLEKIRRLSGEDTFVFVTTAVNAPAVDHIYLFDSCAAVEDLAQRSGFQVRERLKAPYVGLSLQDAEQQGMPINVALVLQP